MKDIFVFRIRRKWLIAGIVSGAVVLFFLLYTVHEAIPVGHVGVVDPFKPGHASAVLEPGLHLKLPWRRVAEVETRLRTTDLPQRERRTADGRVVDVTGFVIWHVPPAGAQAFMGAGGGASVEPALLQSISNAIDAELASLPMADLVAAESDPGKPLTEACLNVTAACSPQATELYGVGLVGVRFNVTLPERLHARAHRRMINRQHRLIDAKRTAKMIEVERIAADADRDVNALITETDDIIHRSDAQADREVTAIYREAGLKPSFVELVETLDRYRQLMDNNAALIVTDDELFGDLAE